MIFTARKRCLGQGFHRCLSADRGERVTARGSHDVTPCLAAWFHVSSGGCRASSVLLFPTFWGLYYFFLLLGKIPTFSYFFRLLLKLIDKNAIFKPKHFFSLTLLGIISFSK